jgi:hypothetical protein
VYNIDFLPQLEASRRHLFGGMPSSPALPYEGLRPLADVRLRGHGPDDGARYVPPQGLKVIEGHEDINGEWVPNPVDPSKH